VIKAVFFDLDNTLLDFVKMKSEAVKNALNAMVESGLSIDPEASFKKIQSIYEKEGWEHQEVFNKFIENEIGFVDNKHLAAGIVAYRRAKEANLKPYPGVRKTLHQLMKMGIKLAIVTDAPSREAWMRIHQMNLHHIFDEVITIDESGERKPSPKPFEIALKNLGLTKDEAIMIGDWPERDVAGANSVGIKSVYARYGSMFKVDNSGANWDADNIYELINIVKSINEN
jgi:putative hydrolase of the HAD superfamily